MFEKEAEEYIKKNDDYLVYNLNGDDVKNIFKDGAEYGYNKADEWHYPSKGELPKEEGYYLVFDKGTKSVIIGMFVDGKFESCFPYAWQYLPEPPKEV